MQERMVKMMKSMIFYPMLWLRGLITILLRMLSGLSFLVGLILVGALFGEEHYALILLLVFGQSFLFFLMAFFYDKILLKLNPTGVDLFLID